jgi:type I restriction enzyme S subunit
MDWVSYSVRRGDVFFTRTSETIDEIGMSSTCLETIPNATFAGFLIRFRPVPALDCRFSKHYFSNPRIRTFFAKEMVLITRASLSQDLLKRLPVLLPPASEQIAICDYLEFDTLTAEAQRAIDLLQERRTALISAAVTGQIDVRQQPKN